MILIGVMGLDLANYSILSLTVRHIQTKALVDCGAVPNVIYTPLYEIIKARGCAKFITSDIHPPGNELSWSRNRSTTLNVQGSKA